MWGSHHWVQPIPDVGYARLRGSGAELAVRMNFVRHVISQRMLFSISRLKLCRYLSIRRETAPPKLEVSFRVTQVL
jgi:hypothetical protein